LVIFCVFLIESIRRTMSLNAGTYFVFGFLGAGLGFDSVLAGSAFGAAFVGGSAIAARISSS
jgi:hypothetical protein